ncbi:helix-turn-helix domain-containing protein [bacterium]|nr:helix-turn-helix domain-containing protein [bacterium]MBU1653181.1 helix-turn-helix domain-containing protein [bacterium]
MDDKFLKQVIEELQAIRQQTAQPVKEVLSVSEAAVYLSISEYTLREWVRKKRIPHSRVCGQVRFKKSKLDKWIDRNEITILN